MFTNLRELIATMPDEKACRDYLIEQRWNGKPVCPFCGFERSYIIENGKRFKCANKECFKKYSVTVGTIMECSNIPLTKWLTAIYLVTAHKKGISSYQLGRDLSIAQKNAWFMLHRIREMMKKITSIKLMGAVEIDETYMSRKYKSDFKGLPPEEVEHILDKGTHANKGAVVGMAERGGDIRVLAFEDRKAIPIRKAIHDNVEHGSRLMTDEAFMYRTGLDEYQHAAVFHSKREWVRNDVHVNNVENFWSVMKRGVHGIYHQISYKHLQAYCNEYSYRYNNRDLKDCERFTISLQNIERRLDYKTLIGKK